MFLFPPLYLDKTSPKIFPNLSGWFSLAQLGSAWLMFYVFLSRVFSPNMASFSPKPFGHVSLGTALQTSQNIECTSLEAFL